MSDVAQPTLGARMAIALNPLKLEISKAQFDLVDAEDSRDAVMRVMERLVDVFGGHWPATLPGVPCDTSEPNAES